MPPLPTAGRRLAEIENLELEIDRLVAGGDGLGRFEGIPIFVPRAAPGDRLRVRLTDRRPDYGRAEILEIVKPGRDRRPAPCPFFARCGGCDLQHLEDARQTELKAAAVRETLQRLAGVTLPADTAIVAGDAWGYRLRTQLHVALGPAGAAVGYFARSSHDLVAVDRCPILAPALEAELRDLGARLPEAPPRRLDLATDESGRVTYAPAVGDLPRGDLELRIGRFVYRYDARCFFQGHRGLLARLVEAVVGEATGEIAFDLYGGVGLFALPLADRYRRVTLVEAERVAARYARANARQARLPHVEIVGRDVESWIAELPAAADRVVVDPPRAGLPPPVRERLAERRPRRLTYVSCHAAALARDLAAFAGAYRIERATLLDLFPQTGHMETVLQLVAAE